MDSKSASNSAFLDDHIEFLQTFCFPIVRIFIRIHKYTSPSTFLYTVKERQVRLQNFCISNYTTTFNTSYCQLPAIFQLPPVGLDLIVAHGLRELVSWFTVVDHRGVMGGWIVSYCSANHGRSSVWLAAIMFFATSLLFPKVFPSSCRVQRKLSTSFWRASPWCFNVGRALNTWLYMGMYTVLRRRTRCSRLVGGFCEHFL